MLRKFFKFLKSLFDLSKFKGTKVEAEIILGTCYYVKVFYLPIQPYIGLSFRDETGEDLCIEDIDCDLTKKIPIRVSINASSFNSEEDSPEEIEMFSNAGWKLEENLAKGITVIEIRNKGKKQIV